MPRKTQTRKPLSTTTDNVKAVAVNADQLASVKATGKAVVKPEATLAVVKDVSAEQQQSEVEQQLRAQIDDLTAKLAAAGLGGSGGEVGNAKTEPIAVEDKKPVIVDDKLSLASVPVAVAAGMAPKRPMTTYQLFASKNRDAVARDRPGLGFAAVNTKLSEMWKSVTAEEKETLEKELAPARERYEVDSQLYEERVRLAKEQRDALEWAKDQEIKKKAMELYEAYAEEQAKKESKIKTAGATSNELPKPKKSLTVHQCFMKLRRAEIADKEKDLPAEGKTSHTDVMVKLNEEWAKLKMSRRKADKALLAKCKKMAEDDDKRHEAEMEQYERDVKARDAEAEAELEKQRTDALEAYRKHRAEENEIEKLKKMKVEHVKAIKAEKAAAREAKKAEKAQKALLPKRPCNAYTFYFAEMAKDQYVRQRVDATPELKLATVVGDMWKNLAENEKEQYKAMAEQDKERYNREMAEMKQN